jgi:hypothetical protein
MLYEEPKESFMVRIAMKSAVFAVLAFAAFRAAAAQPVVIYDIKAGLDPEAKIVRGEERLTWLNATSRAVSNAPFHLYLNAFLNNRSTFMKESGRGRTGRRDDEWGYCRVTGISLDGGEDLLPSLRYVQPDDANADDRTVMEVTLPREIGPGETATFLIEFESKLPRVVSRSGFNGKFFMVAQWFPKLGVLREDGWNCHQYHAHSEFFADFGRYRVEITTPPEYIVGAAGLRTARRRNADGTITVVHEQDRIHDFAWTACPDFVEFRKPFRLSEPRVETEMILLIHREHKRLLPRHLEALTHALTFYSRSYGAYPYPTITLVDPAPGAEGAAWNTPPCSRRCPCPGCPAGYACRRWSPSTNSATITGTA